MFLNERWLMLTTVGVAVTGFLAACSGGQEAGPGAAPGPAVVEVQPAAIKALVLSEELPGRVEAIRTAEVRARIAGIVLSRHFSEGSDVRAGQLLFRIDPAPYKASLARARAELARTEAALAEAQAVVRRYGPLVKVEAVSQQEFDAAQASLKSAEAARQAADADVQTAQLNLGYTEVLAPISGRVGRGLVTEGALVGQGEATPLAVIQQLNPVHVDFNQPAVDVMRARAAGAAAGSGATQLTLAVEGSGTVRGGKLLFANAAVDRSTGQIALRAEFPNQDGLLLPGMYVRVRVSEAAPQQAVMLPQRAIKRAADGTAQVLLLGPDGKVSARAVQTGRMVGSQWHITQGLQGGERVIVGGAPVSAGDPAVAAPAPQRAAAPASAPIGS